MMQSIITVSGRWENLPSLASYKGLKRATSTTNHMFLSAIPFHHTQLGHVVPQSCVLEHGVGKGRQIHKLIYTSSTWPMDEYF